MSEPSSSNRSLLWRWPVGILAALMILAGIQIPGGPGTLLIVIGLPLVLFAMWYRGNNPPKRQ